MRGMERKRLILAIDPGRRKCGLALVCEGEMEWGKVVAADELASEVRRAREAYDLEAIVVGDGTGSEEVKRMLMKEGVPLEMLKVVSERDTSWKARRRYFERKRARGLIGFLRRLLLLPPEPYDHFVAWEIGRRYLGED